MCHTQWWRPLIQIVICPYNRWGTVGYPFESATKPFASVIVAMFLPHDTLHKLVPQTRSGDSILLHPRPRTHPEIILALVPLLPTSKCVQLPGEIWDCILRWTMRPEQDPRTAWEGQRIRLVLVRVCKSFKVNPLSNDALASVTKHDLTGMCRTWCLPCCMQIPTFRRLVLS